GLGGGGVLDGARLRAGVPGRRDHDDARGDGRVDGLGGHVVAVAAAVRVADRQVDHVDAVAVAVVDGPLDALGDQAQAALVVAVDDLDADEGRARGQAAALRPARPAAGDDVGDLAAVAEIVVGRGARVGGHVLPADDLARQVRHRGVDPGVDHRGHLAAPVQPGDLGLRL